MPEPVVSVALATRDGARWLPALLKSIADQTRRPDEVVALDDGSRDGSVRLLEEFASRVPFAVDLVVRDRPSGPRAAFEDALRRSRGDIVLLADQDDVWRGDRVGHLLGALHDEDTTMAFSDAEVIDEQSRPVGTRLWHELHVGTPERVGLGRGDPSPVLRQAVVSGCTAAVRRSVLERALPFPEGLDQPQHPVLHDHWLSWVAACLGRLVAVSEPLVAYRRHPAQVTSAIRTDLFAELTTQLRRDVASVREISTVRRAQLAELDARLGDDLTPTAREAVDAFERFLTARAALPDARRKRLPVLRQMTSGGAHRRFARGWGALAADLARPGPTDA